MENKDHVIDIDMPAAAQEINQVSRLQLQDICVYLASCFCGLSQAIGVGIDAAAGAPAPPAIQLPVNDYILEEEPETAWSQAETIVLDDTPFSETDENALEIIREDNFFAWEWIWDSEQHDRGHWEWSGQES